MKHPNYKPRVIDAKVEEYLSAFGAVCIEGPKWCGKTWTSSHHSKSEIYLDWFRYAQSQRHSAQRRWPHCKAADASDVTV